MLTVRVGDYILVKLKDINEYVLGKVVDLAVSTYHWHALLQTRSNTLVAFSSKQVELAMSLTAGRH